AKLSFFGENREFFRLYMSLRLPEGDAQQQRRHKRTCEPQYRSSLARFAKILQEAMDRHEIRRFDCHRLALFIVEGSNAIVVERVVEETSPSVEQDVEFLTQMIMAGIRPDGVQS